MEDNQLTIYSPQEQELTDYLNRYTDEELRRILSHPKLSVEICEVLMTVSVHVCSQPVEELEKIWNKVMHLDNYLRFKYFVRRLKPARADLLESLDANAKYIEQYAKCGFYMRLLGYVGDTAGTVGDLLMGDSSSDFSNKALVAARALGFLGDAATIAEMYLIYQSYEETMKKMGKDQRLFSFIQQWFQQTEELEEAILNFFPFECRQTYLEFLANAADTELRGARLLAKIFEKAIKDNVEHLRDKTFVENMTCLASTSLIEDWRKWFSLQYNDVQSKIRKMDGKLWIDSFLKITLRLSLHRASTLPPKDQHLKVYLALPFIGLNSWSMLMSAFKKLRKSDISEIATEMRRIKQHLAEEMTALEQIMGYIESKRNE